jgi:hypothetical protein
MSIRRRPRKHVIKPKPRTKHQKLCDRLLQSIAADEAAIEELHNVLYDDEFEATFFTADRIFRRFNTTVTTLQLNFPEFVTYRVHMTYEMRHLKATDGWYYPRQDAVISSSSLAQAATLAYIQISKRIGEFP